MFALRPYQDELIELARDHMRRGKRRVLIQLPTGGGKTALASRMLHNAADRGKRVWFNVHRRELVTQVARAFDLDGLRYGLVTADAPMRVISMAQICSIQTLIKRVSTLPPPDLICWDECHHVASKSWGELAKRFPKAYHIGLSATPQRLDGRGLGEYFDVMVNGPSVAWLIEQGFLSNYRLYAPSKVDTSMLHHRGGEYVTAESEALVNRPTITGDAISHYRKHLNGMSAISFCVSINHSQAVSRAFNEQGIPALHIDGKTAPDLRDEMMKDFQRGAVKILTNCDLFGEGVDVPALDGIIDLAPTMSMARVRQRWGRCLRTYPGKKYGTILDHVGNSHMHGLPDDEIDWALTYDEDVRKKKKAEQPPPRICMACFAASPSRASQCQVCGERFRVEGRAIQQVDGELAEVDEAEKAKRRSQKNPASTFAGLVILAKGREYPAPVGWAINVYRSRLARKGLRGEELDAALNAEVAPFLEEREAERRRKLQQQETANA